MKRILIYITILIIAGCDNEAFFEEERPAQPPWQTVEEFEFAASGAYGLAVNSGWGNFISNDRVMEFIQSDLMYFSQNQEAYPVNDFLNRQTGEISSPMEEAFRNCYKVIGACNAGLDFYYEHDQDPFPEASSAQKEHNIDRIAGELHFLRAFSNFSNVKRHCPQYQPGQPNDDRLLPLRMTFPTGLDNVTNPYFATTQEMYDTIIYDLNRAKELLPEEFNGTHHPSYQYHSRATRYAAAFLLGRVYFQMRNWQKAEEEFSYVIEQGDFSLEPEPIDIFNKDELNLESNELIWYIDYTDPIRNIYGPQRLTHLSKNHYPATGGGRGENWSICPWNQFSLSRSALDAAGWMADPLNGDYTETETARQDKRYNQIYYRMEGYSPDPTVDPTTYRIDAKYSAIDRPIVYSDKYYRAPIGLKSLLPMMRLAEAYLTRSIIRFRLNDQAGAAADLNQVRERAWDQEIAGVPYTPINGNEITEDMIHAERIKELATEGGRIYYLMALSLPIGPGDRDQNILNRVIEPPYENYYWMIDQTELDFKNAAANSGE
ncbi:MAG: RagB/SusD family nutrient uptake outer membrane protein [Candidatus Cyclobacteriaceae bacterium M3_2C_046]